MFSYIYIVGKGGWEEGHLEIPIFKGQQEEKSEM